MESAAKDSKDVTESLTSLIDEIDLSKEGFQKVSDSLANTVNLADTAFGKLEASQREYLESLDDEMQAFSERVQQMLVEYTERVNGQTIERLNTWNEQTQKFTSTMVDAVNTVNEVANQLEDYLSEDR